MMREAAAGTCAEVLCGNCRLGEPAHPLVVGVLEDQGVFVLFDLFITQTILVSEGFVGDICEMARAEPHPDTAVCVHWFAIILVQSWSEGHF